MMYVCTDCGELFPEPHYRKEVEHHSELDQGNKDEIGYIPICPMCHSEEIEPADECILTGEFGNYCGHSLSEKAYDFIDKHIAAMSVTASQCWGKSIAESDILDALTEYIEMRG